MDEVVAQPPRRVKPGTIVKAIVIVVAIWFGWTQGQRWPRPRSGTTSPITPLGV